VGYEKTERDREIESEGMSDFERKMRDETEAE
jgi:hypothetical protein